MPYQCLAWHEATKTHAIAAASSLGYSAVTIPCAIQPQCGGKAHVPIDDRLLLNELALSPVIPHRERAQTFI